MNLATAKLKDSMVRVKALIDCYNQSPKGIFDTINNVTIKDLETLLEGLMDRDISLVGPKLKAGKEIEEDIKVAKVLAHQRKTLWVEGYDKGYKAGRDGEAERVRELVNKFWGL